MSGATSTALEMPLRRNARPHALRSHHAGTRPYHRTTSYLDLLSLSQVDRLVALGTRRGHFRGDILLEEGESCDTLLLLLAGHAKRTVAAEGRRVLLGVEERGALLSDLTVLDGDRQSATVVAVSPGESLSIPRRQFSGFLAADARAASALSRQQAHVVRDLERRRLELLTRTTRSRLAGRLLELAERFGERRDGAIEIDLDLSQEELGGWISASVRATATALQDLREMRVVATSRRTIRVLDCDALRRHAT